MSTEIQPKEKKKRSLASLGYVLKEIILPRKKLLFVGLILIVFNRLSGLVLPGASKYLIDDVIGKGDTGLLYMLLMVVGAAVAVQSVTSFSLTRLLSVEAQHLISLLRAMVQKQLIYFPVRFFDNNKSGALVSRIMTCLLYTSPSPRDPE